MAKKYPDYCQTVGCGRACPIVWEGWGREAPLLSHLEGQIAIDDGSAGWSDLCNYKYMRLLKKEAAN